MKKLARVGTTLAAVVAFETVLMTLAGDDWRGAHAQSAPQGEARPASKAKAATKSSAAKKDGNPEASDDASAAAKKAADPAETEKVLAAAQKSLESGKADIAAKQIDSLLARGGLPPRNLASALAIRGHAYRKLSKPAQAIADLQSALYIKNGLSEAERTSAAQARTEAYREAGLATPAPIVTPAAVPPPKAPPKQVAQPTPVAPVAPVATSAKPVESRPIMRVSDPQPSSPMITGGVPVKAAPEPAPAAASGGGIGGFFSNMFGGGEAKARDADKNGDPYGYTPPKPTQPAVSSWSEPGKTSTAVIRPASTTASPAAAPAPALAQPKPAKAVEPGPSPPGKSSSMDLNERKVQFALRLAAQRSSADAKTLAERIKREHAAELANRKYEIDEAVFGNMGKFYRANVGPFADLEGAKTLCTAIRAKGVDCEVISL